MNLKHIYRRVENRIGLFGILLFGLEILIVLALVWKIPLNNFRLERVERNFRMLAQYHPVDSTLLSKRKFVGTLYSGAFSCSYVVGEFRVSALTREDIRNAYADTAVPSFKRWTRLPVHVRFADEGFLDDPWYEWRDEAVGGLAAKENVYSVHVAHTRYSSPFGDFRCL